MIIAFVASKNTWECELEARFGRTLAFVLLDTETNILSLYDNAKNAELGHGAGIQTAKAIFQTGASIIITVTLGPKAFAALKEANLSIYYAESNSTIRSAFMAFEAKQLKRAELANH